MSNQVSPLQVFYSKISQPALNILDIIASVNKERSWDMSRVVNQNQFKSTTAARRAVKPFIVGFIPPDVTVNFVPVQASQQILTTLINNPPPATNPPTATAANGAKIIQYPNSFYQQLGQLARNIGARPEDVIAMFVFESGMNAQSINFKLNPDGTRDLSVPQARGLNQITPIATRSSGMSLNYWNNTYSTLSAQDQLPFVQNYFKSKGVSSYPSVGDLYLANIAPAFIGASDDTTLYAKGTKAYKQNQGLDVNGDGVISVGDLRTVMDRTKQRADYQAYVDAYQQATSGGGQAPSTAQSNNQGITDFTNNDSAINTPANNVATTSIMTNGTITDADAQDPLKDQLGRNIQVSDTRRPVVQAQTNYLNQQIQLIQGIPALVLLLNPTDFTRSYEQTTDPVKTRSGYTVNMWLEKPLVISCKGVTAAQYAFQVNGGGGLTSLNRLNALSYQNLMSLVSMYKNNGYIFTDSSFGDGNSGLPLISMSLFIYYDNHVYIGSFNDFSLTDDGNKPFNLSYSWKFTVRYDVDTSNVSGSLMQQQLG